MATLEIPELTLVKLKEGADAVHLPIEQYVDSLADIGLGCRDRSRNQAAAILEFTRTMTEWTEKNLPPGHVVDDSRESMYPDRD